MKKQAVYFVCFTLLGVPLFAKDKPVFKDAVLASYVVKRSDVCDYGHLYTVKEGTYTFVLRPEPRSWNRCSVMNGLLPGKHVGISVGRKYVLVRVGKDVSKFDIVEAK